MGKRNEKEIAFKATYNDRIGAFSLLKASLRSIQGPLSQINSKFEQLKGKLGSLGKTTKQIGSGVMNLGTAMSLPSLFSSIGGFITLETSGNFEEALIKIEALAKSVDSFGKKVVVTQEDLKALSKEARNIGATTQFTATDALEGMKYLAMAGWNDKNTILNAIAPTMDLTGAAKINSDISLPRVADILTNIMAPFEINPAKSRETADKLAFAFTESNQNLEDLGMALRNFAPIAKKAGISFEESLAILMELANKGIKETIAGTALAGLTSRMTNLPREGVEVAHKYFSQDEIASFIKPTGEIKSITRLLELIDKKKMPLGPMIKLMGIESGRYLASAVGKQDKIRENVRRIHGETPGLAKKLNDTNVRGYKGQIELLKSSLDDVALAVGDAGLTSLFTRLAIEARKVSDAVANIPAPALAGFAYAATALTGLGLAAGAFKSAKFIGQITGLTTFLAPLKSFLFKVGGFFLSLKGLLIGLAAYGLWFTVQNWDELKKSLPILKKVEEIWDKTTDFLRKLFFKDLDKVTKLWNDFSQQTKKVWDPLSSSVIDWFKNSNYKFIPDFLSGEEVHAPFEKKQDEAPKKDTVKVELSFRQLPRGTSISVDNPSRIPMDTYTGWAMEGIG